MSENELYDYAITLLAKTDYSSGSLRHLLSKLTEKEEDIDRVVRRLTDSHYLNDTQLINDLIDKYIKKHHGPILVGPYENKAENQAKKLSARID